MKQLAQLPIEVVDVTEAEAAAAAKLSATNGLDYLDCIAAATAQQHRATLVTTNKELSRFWVSNGIMHPRSLFRRRCKPPLVLLLVLVLSAPEERAFCLLLLLLIPLLLIPLVNSTADSKGLIARVR
jgi:hypothetical protein